MFSLLRSVRPCSKRICGCYDRAIKLSLYLPIDKDDEIENDKKKDEFAMCIVFDASTRLARSPENI